MAVCVGRVGVSVTQPHMALGYYEMEWVSQIMVRALFWGHFGTILA